MTENKLDNILREKLPKEYVGVSVSIRYILETVPVTKRDKVISKIKTGQVHFIYTGDKVAITSYFNYIKSILIQDTKPITSNMKKFSTCLPQL